MCFLVIETEDLQSDGALPRPCHAGEFACAWFHLLNQFTAGIKGDECAEV